MNESEPLKKHRNDLDNIKTAVFDSQREEYSGRPVYWLYDVRCRNGMNLNAGFVMEREKPCFHAKGKVKRRTRKADNTDGKHGGGLWCSSEEVSVMEMERRP